MPGDSRLKWKSSRSIQLAGGVSIPVADNLQVDLRDDAGLKPDSPGIRPRSAQQLRKLKLAYPFSRLILRTFNLGHEFVYDQVGAMMKQYLRPGDVFLEAGACDMLMRKYLPRGIEYNGFDFAWSEFHLRRSLASDPNMNLAVASITDIPLDDSLCDMVIAVEMLQQIPDVDKALSELHRILKPGGKLLCSVANGHSRKYDQIGVHALFAHRFRFDDIKSRLERTGFSILEGKQMGKWSKLRLLGNSRHTPVTSADERENCYFIFACEAKK